MPERRWPGQADADESSGGASPSGTPISIHIDKYDVYKLYFLLVDESCYRCPTGEIFTAATAAPAGQEV